MARRKKPFVDRHQPYWLLTFSDMNTLLLTFFVLLFSMSSIDAGQLSRMLSLDKGDGLMVENAAGRLPGYLTEPGTPARAQLLREWDRVLVRLAGDGTLSRLDRIAATDARVSLARAAASRARPAPGTPVWP